METIRTIKGFDHELKCRGFQYEVGKTYTAEAIGAMTLEEVVNLLNVQANEIKIQRLAVERYRESEKRCEKIINEIKELLK